MLTALALGAGKLAANAAWGATKLAAKGALQAAKLAGKGAWQATKLAGKGVQKVGSWAGKKIYQHYLNKQKKPHRISRIHRKPGRQIVSQSVRIIPVNENSSDIRKLQYSQHPGQYQSSIQNQNQNQMVPQEEEINVNANQNGNQIEQNIQINQQK